MTDDIVTRLRKKYAGQLPICLEAADEIERLHAELDKYQVPQRIVRASAEWKNILKETHDD